MLLVDFAVSEHARQRASERNISIETIQQVVNMPDTIVEDGPGQKIYQANILFATEKIYLVRVFVNIDKDPPLVKSVYRTSKLSKYDEGEI